jgi:hypothetical protein
VELRIRIPVTLRGETLANVLGLAGLLGIALCLGSWAVAGLVASLELVGLAYVAHTHAAAAPAAAERPAPVRAAA